VSTNNKCRAKGGVATCKDPNCPEKRQNYDDFRTSVANFVSNRETKMPEFTPNVPDVRANGDEVSINGKVVGAWSEKDTVLLKTIHGSTLYGLNHADSDEDYYVVTPTNRISKAINAKQTIIDGVDTLAVDFASFVELSHKGVPQALEAMFSRKSKSEFFEEYRNSYFAADPEVQRTYMRTIKNFSFSDTFKLRRHSLRLAYNLNEMMHTGRFDPTLSTKTIDTISKGASLPPKEFSAFLTKFSPLEVDWDASDPEQKK